MANKVGFEKEWRDRFRRFGERYYADHLVSGWSESGLRERLALFDRLLKARSFAAHAQILDIGCGAGTYVRFLAGFGHKVVGLDYSLPSLYRALLADSSRIGHYLGGEAYHLPFRNEVFDLVVSIGVFQVLTSPQQALDEMVRVLRPGGVLVVDFLNALELVALARSIYGRLRGDLPRLHTYSPFQVHRWLSHRGLKAVKRAGVYLPPRRLTCFKWIFDSRAFIRFVERISIFSLAGAHVFLLIGQKDVK